MLKAVIFDMDGVIIDSQPLIFEVCIGIMSTLGVTITASDLNKYVGIVDRVIWAKFREQYGLKLTVEELLRLQADAQIKRIKEYEQTAIPGIPALLEILTANGMPLALASSAPLDYIHAIIEKLNIKHYFNVVLSGEQVENGKPAPDIFLKAAALMGVTPDSCIVIEDSTNGIKAAVSAGMKCIGYKNPNSGCQNLSAASVQIDSFCGIDYRWIKGIAED